MPRSSRAEERLLALAESRGVPIDRAALKRKFNFVVSPITTNRADVSIPAQIAREVTTLAEASNLSFELTGIVIFPIIADPTIYARPDFLTHKRASKGYFVGQNIEFQRWDHARRPGRIKLTLENFSSSIRAIPDRHLSPRSKNILVHLVEVAVAKASEATDAG
jgi:hypothetical protein